MSCSEGVLTIVTEKLLTLSYLPPLIWCSVLGTHGEPNQVRSLQSQSLHASGKPVELKYINQIMHGATCDTMQ